MISLDTIYSQLEEALNINSIDSVFSRDYLIDLVNQQRALWLRNEYNKNKRSIDPNIVQDLGCIPLQIVSAIDCCEGIPLDCVVLRTKCKIPNTLEFYSTKALTRVGPIDLTQKMFNFIDYKRVPYSGTSKLGQMHTYAFLYNEYIYVYSKNTDILLLEYLNVRGVFENPLKAIKCLCDNNSTQCVDKEASYPLNMWTWEYIRPIIVDQLIKKQIVPQDQSNNTKDDKNESVKTN